MLCSVDASTPLLGYMVWLTAYKFPICGMNITHGISGLKRVQTLFLLVMFTSFITFLFFCRWNEELPSIPEDAEREVEGWERNRSRDVLSYAEAINGKPIISPNICAGERPFLLVVVCSAVENAEARHAVRETWAAELNGSGTAGVHMVFLLGYKPTLQLSVQDESNAHGDIVQERFLDSYNNLTLKSVMLLKWVRQECSNALHVMKTDDDTMVWLRPLQELLRSYQTVRGTRFLLTGYRIRKSKPIREPSHKWYMPKYLYASAVFPNYLSGSGYVMSQDAVKALFEASFSVPITHMEDVYITGQCAEHAGIRRRHSPGFSYKRRRMTTCALGHPKVITSHGHDPESLRQAWNLSHMSTARCAEEWRADDLANHAQPIHLKSIILKAISYLFPRNESMITSTQVQQMSDEEEPR